MGNMGSAHLLVEVNVSCKFEGNPSISQGVIEQTDIMCIITYANKFPYIILLTATDQYFSISGV